MHDSVLHAEDDVASPEDEEAVRAQLLELFPTRVYACEEGPSHLHEELELLARRLAEDTHHGPRRAGVGGRNGASDFFDREEPVVAEFREHMREHVQAYLDHLRPEGCRQEDYFRLRGRIDVVRAGDSPRIHCPPGCFLTATYYVRVPAGVEGGRIVFRDPRRPVVAMHETPDIDLPWVGDGVDLALSPRTGLLLLVPSWLEHRVEPFEGPGERLSIAFSASRS